MFDDELMIHWIALSIMMTDDHHNEQNNVEKSISVDWYDESSLIFERIDHFHRLSKNNSWVIARFVEHSIAELIERLMIQQEMKMKMLQRQM